MAKDKKVEQITDMEVDFAQWFTDVCKIDLHICNLFYFFILCHCLFILSNTFFGY